MKCQVIGNAIVCGNFPEQDRPIVEWYKAYLTRKGKGEQLPPFGEWLKQKQNQKSPSLVTVGMEMEDEHPS